MLECVVAKVNVVFAAGNGVDGRLGGAYEGDGRVGRRDRGANCYYLLFGFSLAICGRRGRGCIPFLYIFLAPDIASHAPRSRDTFPQIPSVQE